MSVANPEFNVKAKLVVRIPFRFMNVSYKTGEDFPPKGIKAGKHQIKALYDCYKLWPKELHERNEASKKAKEAAAKPEEKQAAAVKAPAKPESKDKAKPTPKDKPKAKPTKTAKAKDKQAETDAPTAVTKPWDK